MGKVVSEVKALAAKTDDLSSITGTYMAGENWLPERCPLDLHKHRGMYIRMHKYKKKTLEV